jgi:DNA adenine methylase
MRYPGGKNGSGVYQRLISMMPPHDVYIELFLGSGSVMRRKKPADRMSYAYELDPRTIAEFVEHVPAESFAEPARPDPADWHFEFRRPGGDFNLHVSNSSGLDALKNTFAADSGFWLWNDPARSIIYADPPYLVETRKSAAKLYAFEMMEKSQHVELLDLLAAVPCKVMVSGYRSTLYNRKLKNWRREVIPTTNRAGDRVEEIVWLNFPEPFELHDYQHLGDNYRDRWTIKKRARRWVKNWQEMPPALRYAVLAELQAAREAFAAEETTRDAGETTRRRRIAKRRHRANVKPQLTTPPAAILQTLFD